MPRKKIIGRCSVENCERPLKNKGLCQYHYNKKRLEENPAKRKAGVTGHPYYHLWHERKQANALCERWLDFKTFIFDIIPRPDGEFILARKTEGLYSPENYKWVEHLRRRPDENLNDWWARKLEHRKSVNPNLESDRNLKRKFNMTREEYNEKLKSQNYVCEICKSPETSIDHRTNTLRRLAVDHCHTTNKIRDLLCWRCNGTLGRTKESLKLLQEIMNYIIKHN